MGPKVALVFSSVGIFSCRKTTWGECRWSIHFLSLGENQFFCCLPFNSIKLPVNQLYCWVHWLLVSCGAAGCCLLSDTSEMRCLLQRILRCNCSVAIHDDTVKIMSHHWNSNFKWWMMIYLWQKLSEIIILVPSLDSYTHSFSFMEIQSLSLEKIQSRSGSEKGNKINEPEVCVSTLKGSAPLGYFCSHPGTGPWFSWVLPFSWN